MADVGSVIELVLEYWVLVAVPLLIGGSAWLMVRTIRTRAPFLLERSHGARVSVDEEEDRILLVEGGQRKGLSWREVDVVWVVTTSQGPLAEDLFLELEGSQGSARIKIPSGAAGFDQLLQSIGDRLPGFDFDVVVDAAARSEEAEHVVWQRWRARPQDCDGS